MISSRNAAIRKKLYELYRYFFGCCFMCLFLLLEKGLVYFQLQPHYFEPAPGGLRRISVRDLCFLLIIAFVYARRAEVTNCTKNLADDSY